MENNRPYLSLLIRSCLQGDEYFCDTKQDLVFHFYNGRDGKLEEEEICSKSEGEQDDTSTSSSSTSYEASPIKKRKPEPSKHRKRMAVEFWRSGKKGPLKLDTVRHNFSFITSRMQLHCYEKQIMEAGSLKGKFQAIRSGILSRCKAAKSQHLVVHDKDLHRWALEEN